MKVTAATLLALSCASAAAAADTPLPIVDLGYELQQATEFNATGNYYNFSNIRYAAPPLGNLRWAAPQAPAVNRSTVQTGQQGRTCYQSQGDWLATAEAYLPLYLSGQQKVFNTSSFPAVSSSLTPGPTETEDCLFLDVMSPKHAFNKTGYGAPVLVWIHGGGNAYGAKDYWGHPGGLLARSQHDNSTGVVYVSINYRLGAVGFLSGGDVQANGSANAGLLDQRFALEWVQKNIHLFGGDPARVTVFGESAGGSGILHQVTAYGGSNGSVPFAQALVQSPAFLPTASSSQQEMLFQRFLAYANVSTLAELRNLSTEAIQNANARVVAASPYGGFTYGPVVDGSFVPALPGKLLANGQFDRSLGIMTAHNGNEGLLFTPPHIQNDSDFVTFVESQFPLLAGLPDSLSNITDVLYPSVFDGTYGYTDQIGRGALFMSESIIGCNTFYLNKAFHNQTHSYLFDIYPSLHAADIPYSFYNANGSATSNISTSGVTEPQTAMDMQAFIGRFAVTGDPNGPGLPYFPTYGNNATILVLNGPSLTSKVDPVANQRCNWWQRALYY